MSDLQSIVERPAVVAQSLQAAVYERLREMIHAGELQQLTAVRGLRLRQLADLLGVSTMPVREAVRRLEAEGLIDFPRGGGVSVVRLSRRSIEEIAEMRVRLESLALDRALLHLRQGHIDAAGRLLEQMDDPLSADEWRQTNKDFHWALYRPCDYQRVLNEVATLWTLMEPSLKLYTTASQHLVGAQEEHVALYAAWRDRDAATARDLVEGHIRRSLVLVLEGTDTSVMHD